MNKPPKKTDKLEARLSTETKQPFLAWCPSEARVAGPRRSCGPLYTVTRQRTGRDRLERSSLGVRGMHVRIAG